jgi:cobalt-zinc-cadmium efflux system outer membrane protein
MRVLLVSVGSALLSAGPAPAQPVPAAGAMTVDEVVTRALAENPELRAARADIEAAAGRLRQAGLRPNPMLELGYQRALSADNNFMAGVTLPLDLNGRKEGRVGVAERELALKQAQVLERERRLRAEIRMKAGELLAARRNVRTTEDLLEINQGALRVVRDRVREGAAPALDESLQLVEVSRLEAARELTRSRVDVVALQLRALAGLTPEAPLDLRGVLPGAGPPWDRAEALRRAVAERPDLATARAEAAMADARIRKEEADGRWDASVNVGYQRQDFGFGLNGLTDRGGTRPIHDVFHYFGGGVTVTLPVRNRNEGNVAAAAAEARGAQHRVELAGLVVRQEVESVFVQRAATERSLRLYETGVRSVAARNLEVVRETYRLGRSTLLEVIAEQRRFVEIETGYTEALKQVYDAGVEIERAVGAAAR